MKNIKKIIGSLLLATAFAATSVGTTFALFTDEAKTTINVQSGKIELKSALTIAEVKSLNDSTIDTHTMITDEAHKNASYENGGAVAISTDSVTNIESVSITKWTPGDSVKLLATPNNSGTNINTLIRLQVTMTGELAPALVVKGYAGDATDPSFMMTGERTNVTPWTPVDVGENPSSYYLEVSFPNHGSEITSRLEGTDNHYQDKEASIIVSYQAVQGNASTNDVLERANSLLATHEVEASKRYETMNAALKGIESHFTDAELVTLSQYVWGSQEDQFYPESSITSNHYKYFKVANSMEQAGNFSIYASSSWTTSTVNLEGRGFDAGDASGITQINYIGAAEAKEVVIRTNSMGTSLVVNAPQDIVHHYDDLGTLNIIAVANGSYHEFGRVGFVEVAKGRVALESTAEVAQVHLNAIGATEGFEEIIIAKDPEAPKPEFTRDAVSIPAEGRLVVALQETTKTEAEKDYVWLTAVGIYEQITVSESKTEAGSTWVDTSDKSDATKETAKDIANNISVAVGETTYTVQASGEDRSSYVLVESESGVESEEYTVTSASLVVTETQEQEETVVNTTAEVIVQDLNETTVANTTTAANGITEAEKESTKEAQQAQYVVATIGSTNYYELKHALESVQKDQTLTVIKNCVLDSRAVVYSPVITDYRFNLVINATVEFVGEGQIMFDVTSNSCRIYLSGTGTLLTEDNNLIMLKSGFGILNQQKNEVVEVEGITVRGGKFSDCKVKFNGGHFDTQITGVVNMEQPGWSQINGGTFVTKPEGVTIKIGFTLEQNSTTHFWELVVDIPANAIFKLIPTDNPDNVDYISASQLNADGGKLTGEYSGQDFKLELLKDVQFSLYGAGTSNAFWSYKFGISGRNVTIDLKGYTFRFTNPYYSYSLSYLIAYDDTVQSFTIENGTITVDNNIGVYGLFYAWTSVGVTMNNVTLNNATNNRNW